LAVILVGNWDTTRLILSSLTSLALVNEYRFWILGSFSILTVLFQTFWGPKWSKTHVVELMILGPILYFTPLLIGFIVYFGFWHSLPSMLKEYDFLQKFKAYDTPLKFMIQLIPFTLISLVGIALILFLGVKYLDENALILLFFVMISLISFPHILYMDQFIRKKTQN
jgi:Brp/Blh family beta-carotene 15,15'-monooxygenase